MNMRLSTFIAGVLWLARSGLVFAFPGENGDILYMTPNTTGPCSQQIELISSTGDNPRNLTAGTGFTAAYPRWSPNGRQIAFSGFLCGASPQEEGLFVINSDGTGLHEIPIWPARGAQLPAWSPDASQIVFMGIDDENRGTRTLFIVRADGTELQRFRVTAPGFVDYYYSIDWSMDGASILVSATLDYPCPITCSFGTEAHEIYLFDVSSRTVTRITNNQVQDEYARWSPDGKKIAFHREGKILTMDTATKHEIVMTSGRSSSDLEPTWSPDGAFIAYRSFFGRKGPHALYVMQSDGKGKRQLIAEGVKVSPDWQPVIQDAALDQ
jgi:dipeptidyl aminopeptidase/acylaminoacyl peptidase